MNYYDITSSLCPSTMPSRCMKNYGCTSTKSALLLLCVALQTIYGHGPLFITPFWFLKQFTTHGKLLGRFISMPKGLCLHRATQHKEMKGNQSCPKRDSNPRPSVSARGLCLEQRGQRMDQPLSTRMQLSACSSS